MLILVAAMATTCKSPDNSADKQEGNQESPAMRLEVYETSAQGSQLKLLNEYAPAQDTVQITLSSDETFQTITGFGGAFTQASASLLNKLSKETRAKVLEAYFGESGARYSLTRTHMNSCDFSEYNYSYAAVEGDKELENFSIEEDGKHIIPMIKEAMAVSQDGFKIISSPWTAPPWMKDNQDWKGGKLLPEYYETWALFFSKYYNAYQAQGIDIWGFTVENEPLGNDSNWESMHYTPEEMNDFVKNHLGPQLQGDGIKAKLLGYDQNRDEELKKWVTAMYEDPDAAKYFDGTAIHWYASTYDYFPEALQFAHNAAPDKHLIQSEACVDAEVPVWQDDAWYWKKEATDWGWDWASDEDKPLHPKYAPVYRYARDIIGCLNNWVDGWVDWNMVLDKQGGPNWAKNWCIAPVIVDPENDEVYLTPIYYTMSHFSRFIRPDAQRIGLALSDESLMATAAQNPDGSIAVVILNQGEEAKRIQLILGDKTQEIAINGQAVQTLMITRPSQQSASL